MTTASLFVPTAAGHFLEQAVEDYRTKLEPRAREPKPKHRDLIEGIGAVSLSTIRDLWVDMT
jgi:hypothetical protein